MADSKFFVGLDPSTNFWFRTRSEDEFLVKTEARVTRSLEYDVITEKQKHLLFENILQSVPDLVTIPHVRSIIPSRFIHLMVASKSGGGASSASALTFFEPSMSPDARALSVAKPDEARVLAYT